MADILIILTRLGTLVLLLVLVLVALVADLLLVPFMLIICGPLGACTSIAVDAASAALRRLFGFEEHDL